MRAKSSQLYLFFIAVLGFLFSVAAQHQLRKMPNRRQTLLTDFQVSDFYVGDLAAVMVGARRMAANLAYIQMMQYYGVHSDEDPAITAQSGEGHHHHEEEAEDFDFTFKKLQEYGLRIVRLDPLFNAAILEISGALAFNQQRFDEATDLLKEAIVRDPSFYRYRLYMAAILYRGSGQDAELMRILDEAIRYPDCPALLKNILANLHKKYGHFEKAALIYLNMIETAHTESDRHQGQEGLELLLKAHPDLLNLPELRRI